MAQNVTIAGNQYPSVPSIQVPKTGGGGNATFTDVSDTTAIAADVGVGKYFYAADGTKTAGSYVAPTPRTASDVTVSGNTVTIPSGAYASQVQKSVATGTAGTPTATKGAVSNHAVSVTPSVTNTTGYITGGTISGTAVSVSASELVSGTKSITANGTGIDVAEYASVDVNVSSGGAFVVTATFTNNEWSTLDKTFAQIQSAYSQGLTIEVSAFDTYAYMQCGTWCKYDNEAVMFLYSVSWFDYQDTGYQFVDTYIMTSTETVLDDRQEYGTPTTLVQKTITANGTYNPILTDYADGYSLVTVNVSGGGGASNIVTGTFTGTTTGAAMDITLNYSGSGYPIVAAIYPSGGVTGNSAFSTLVQRYAAAMFCVTKASVDLTPAYAKTQYVDEYVVLHRYKSSSSSAYTYGQASGQTYIATGSDTTATNTNIMNFKSKTTMSVFIANTSYGFAANIEYTYQIIYSS